VAIKAMQTFNPKGYEAAQPIITSFKTVFPKMETEVQGVNAADRFTMLLVSHRDPVTLAWNKKPILDIQQNHTNRCSCMVDVEEKMPCFTMALVVVILDVF
jgi:hypothetical protein